jgi:hypothetical protein
MIAKLAHPARCLLAASFFAAAGASADEHPASIQEVHAPVWVGRPPSDAISGLVRLENGELRHYDYGFDPTPEIHHHPDFLATSYIFSRDQGLTWETKPVPPGQFGADMRSPISGEYLRLQTKADGLYVIKTNGGIDGEWTLRRVWATPIRGPELNLTRSLVFIRKGKRALSPWSTMRRFAPDFRYQVGTFFSDDDGATWQRSNLIEAPAHEPNERDKSVRWQNGATEPSVVELRDGRVWMLIRTSLDFHYQSFSTDGGATWSAPEPSPFYGTLTDPTIGRLKDGRLLFLWNNTTPLPEFPKNEFTAPFITQSAADGSGEDMFTNRDALHAAISDDDGKTWRGFREVLLDANRNDSRYAETGGMDRSVHQPQFVEVDAGRVVVSTGQHWLHRSLFIFDPDWLLETERACDFSNGLDDWSVHGYLKGIRGHCALNRFESSKLIAHPDDAKRRVLQVSNTGRRDAIFERGGATWNFPAGRAGFVEVRVRASKDFGGARLCLLDRWLNPTDPTAHTLAMCQLDLAADQLPADGWHTLRLSWQEIAVGAPCEVTLDEKPLATLPLQRAALHGVSYIHFQSTAQQPDQGLLIESVRAEITPPHS